MDRKVYFVTGSGRYLMSHTIVRAYDKATALRRASEALEDAKLPFDPRHLTVQEVCTDKDAEVIWDGDY